MSGKIDLLFKKEVQSQISDVKASLEEVLNTMLEISKESRSNNGLVTQRPGDLTTQVNSNKAAIDAFNKSNVEFNKQLLKSADLHKRESSAIKAKIPTLRQLSSFRKAEEKEKLRLERLDKQREKSAAKLNSRYQRLNSIFVKLKNEYRDLGIKKELNGKLSLREEKRLATLTTRVTQLDTAFKKTDATMGVHNRNVGNYASGWDGLGNSINQLSREMPAFANSVQTGFMAISNNLPMLFDEIGKIRTQNKLLAKEGKPTTSVLKQIGGAMFGLGTLLSIGVTLLTVYGDEMVEFAQKLFKGKDSLIDLSKAYEQVNEKAAESAGQSIGKFQALISVIQDETESEEARLEAKRQLADEYPDFNSKILDEKNATLEVNSAIDKYVEKLEMKAKAQAAMEIIQEKYAEIVKKEVELNEIQSKITAKDIKLKVALIEAENKGANIRRKILKENEGSTKVFRQMAEVQKELNDLQLDANKFISIYGQNLVKTTESYNDEIKASEKSEKSKKEIKEVVKNSIPYFQDQIKILEEQQDKLPVTSEKWVELGERIAIAKDALKDIQNFDSKVFDPTNDLDKLVEDIEKYNTKKLEDELKERKRLEEEYIKFRKKAIKDVSQLWSSQLGIDSVNFYNAIDGMFNHMEAKAAAAANGVELTFNEKFANLANIVGSSVLAMSDIIGGMMRNNSEATIQRIDDQIEANEEYYDNQIKLAEGNDKKQELLEQEKEDKEAKLVAKKKKEQEKQAKFEKAQTLLNIGIQTSLGVISALSQVPKFDFGVSATALATTIGAIGAAQLAFAAAQPLPKYKDGTDNHKGGFAVVGDGGVNEYIQTPDGSLYETPNKDTIIDLPKGSKVYPNLDAMKQNTDLSDSIYSASILASVALDNQRISNHLKAEKVLNEKLLEEMRLNTKAVKNSKSSLRLTTQKTDINHFLWAKNNTKWG